MTMMTRMSLLSLSKDRERGIAVRACLRRRLDQILANCRDSDSDCWMDVNVTV